jgi:hypothetical protein
MVSTADTLKGGIARTIDTCSANVSPCSIIGDTNTMFDLTAGELRRSLAETIGWCGRQPITARLTETPELVLCRSLVEQGHELTDRALASRHRFWGKILRRNPTKTREWKMGMERFQLAQQTLPPSLAEELRSIALKPGSGLGEARTEQQRESIVRSVIVKRSELLGSGEVGTLPNIATNLCGGRLLIYVPVENLADGAAEYASKRYFDVENAPPWDTWVAYSDRTLLSWVPAELIALVQQGIDVNPEECIRWMS